MKQFKVWLLLALVFVAGFAGGMVTTRVATKRFVQRAIANPGQFRARIERDLAWRLRLDPQQRQEVQRILRESHERMRSEQEKIRPEMLQIMRDTHDRISDVLKPEQREQFEKFLTENRPFLPAPLRDGAPTNRLLLRRN
jgi:uncharacterized protein with von Willebrand factor type A (vWA) domain